LHNLPPINKKSYYSSSHNNISYNNSNNIVPSTSNNTINFNNNLKPNKTSKDIKINQKQMIKVFNEESNDENININSQKHNNESFNNGSINDIPINDYKFNIKSDKEDYEDAQLKEINNFNANLMNNPDWGNNNQFTSHNVGFAPNSFVVRMPLKPSKKKIENELGNLI